MLQENSKAKDGGAIQNATPKVLAQLLVKVMQPKLGEHWHDPAAGFSGFLVEIDKYLRENNQQYQTLTEEERKEIEKGELLLDAGIQPGVRNILLSAMPEEEIVSMAETIVAHLTDDIGMSRQQIDSLRQIREWTRPIGQSPEAEDFDRKTARLILSAAGSPHAGEI